MQVSVTDISSDSLQYSNICDKDLYSRMRQIFLPHANIYDGNQCLVFHRHFTDRRVSRPIAYAKNFDEFTCQCNASYGANVLTVLTETKELLKHKFLFTPSSRLQHPAFPFGKRGAYQYNCFSKNVVVCCFPGKCLYPNSLNPNDTYISFSHGCSDAVPKVTNRVLNTFTNLSSAYASVLRA